MERRVVETGPGAGRVDPFASVVDLVAGAAAAPAVGAPVAGPPPVVDRREALRRNIFVTEFSHRISRATFVALRPASRGLFEELAAQENALERYHADELEKLSANEHFSSISGRIPRGAEPAEESLAWIFTPEECDTKFRHALHDLVELQIKLKVSAGALHERTLSDRDKERMRLQSMLLRRTLRDKYYADRGGRIRPT